MTKRVKNHVRAVKLEGHENVLQLVKPDLPPVQEYILPVQEVLIYFMHSAVITHNPYACLAAFICLSSQMDGRHVSVTPELHKLIEEINPDDLLSYMPAEDIYGMED